MSEKGRFTRELIGLIGLEATRKLIAAFGSQHVYFPEVVPPDHPLALELGQAEAETLSRHYAGLRLLIPRGYRFLLRERNRAIWECHRGGMTTSEIARRFDLCHRQVRAILHQPLAPDVATLPPDFPLPSHRQLRLF